VWAAEFRGFCRPISTVIGSFRLPDRPPRRLLYQPDRIQLLRVPRLAVKKSSSSRGEVTAPTLRECRRHPFGQTVVDGDPSPST